MQTKGQPYYHFLSTTGAQYNWYKTVTIQSHPHHKQKNFGKYVTIEFLLLNK